MIDAIVRLTTALAGRRGLKRGLGATSLPRMFG